MIEFVIGIVVGLLVVAAISSVISVDQLNSLFKQLNAMGVRKGKLTCAEDSADSSS